MRAFPKTQIRDLQFDSFFIDNVKKVQDSEKRLRLTPDEAYWLYHSETKLHEFVRRATLDTKIALLAKLDVWYCMTVMDENEGSDRLKWTEQLNAARGEENAIKWFDNYVLFSHSMVYGSMEVQRLLARLEIMHHSKIYPISRYIKRLRDYKKLDSYEDLLKQGDFIYFLFKVAIGYSRIEAGDNALGVSKKELCALVLLYLEHRAMNVTEVQKEIDLITPSYGTYQALEKLRRQNLIEKTNHPFNRGKLKKKFTYMITTEGQSKINVIAKKILNYL